MIIEVAIAVGAATAAYLVVRRNQVKRTPPPAPVEEEPSGPVDPAPEDGPRGLRVGDVVLYIDTEFWLAGRLTFDEAGHVLSLFAAPGASRGSWVAQLDRTAEDLAILSPTYEVPAGHVPESLPIEGRRLRLHRRGTAAVKAVGEHLPETGDKADYAELREPGGRVLLVVDFHGGKRLALHGERVSRHMVELLPGD